MKKAKFYINESDHHYPHIEIYYASQGEKADGYTTFETLSEAKAYLIEDLTGRKKHLAYVIKEIRKTTLKKLRAEE